MDGDRYNHREVWKESADSLCLLADKVLDLEDRAKEQLSLDRYLALLHNLELVLAVKQKRFKNIDHVHAQNRVIYNNNPQYNTCPTPVTVVLEREEHKVKDTQEATITIGVAQSKEDAMLCNLTTHLE